MVARSLQLWREHERRWNRKLYHQVGCIWMAGRNDAFEKASVANLRDVGLAFEQLSPAAAAKRWPQMNFEGVNWIIYEKDAGYLAAHRNCQAVLEGFMQEGGQYRQLNATPGRRKGTLLETVRLSDGSDLAADQFVFACGPWLGKVFSDLPGKLIAPTRQQVFFFGLAAGDSRFS
jgi:glycine/D-amino acid oxidase-like deaminating enzyme